MDRFTYRLAAALALLLPCAVVSAQPATGGKDSRPNILFCLADDWGWPHAIEYGDKVVKTPNFDRVAREGVLFNFCFSAAPSCTPSRASILTGQAPHRLAEGGNLWGFLPSRFAVYPDLLEKAGYAVGEARKGWGPGDFHAGGFTRNPAGPTFKTFEEFLKTVPDGKPFCFWWGSTQPHRPYKKGSGVAAGMKIEDVVVPPYLPDVPEVRSDILDYYAAVQDFDGQVGQCLAALEQRGVLDNTIVVVSGDNGWPFPRGKANLYDAGTRQPLAVRWPAKAKAGRVLDQFVILTDLAPTFLEAAGLKIPGDMTGHSILGLLTGEDTAARDAAFAERERHANVRAGDASYPCRAIRTRDFLYIHNFALDRWPAGDPEKWKSVGSFGDIDGGPSKDFIIGHRDEEKFHTFFELACGKRPAEELYDVRKDPYELKNVAGHPDYAAAQEKLRAELQKWMSDTADPRAVNPADDAWSHYEYFGEGPASRVGKKTGKAPGGKKKGQ